MAGSFEPVPAWHRSLSLDLGVQQSAFGHAPEVIRDADEVAGPERLVDAQHDAGHEIRHECRRGKRHRAREEQAQNPDDLTLRHVGLNAAQT